MAVLNAGLLRLHYLSSLFDLHDVLALDAPNIVDRRGGVRFPLFSITGLTLPSSSGEVAANPSSYLIIFFWTTAAFLSVGSLVAPGDYSPCRHPEPPVGVAVPAGPSGRSDLFAGSCAARRSACSPLRRATLYARCLVVTGAGPRCAGDPGEARGGVSRLQSSFLPIVDPLSSSSQGCRAPVPTNSAL